jgi:uncharacterized protein (DUF924 family)
MSQVSTVQKILEFWFGEAYQTANLQPQKKWFVKDANFDQTVREWFLGIYEQAAAGRLDDWMMAAESALALTIVLDQFPRNMFRDSAKAFATDSRAFMVAQQAIDLGFDQDVMPVMRVFFYLPFEHSENLDHQNEAVRLFQPFSADPELRQYYDFALRHQAIVTQFGRFPHRNQMLGRVSTAEEIEFLQQPGSGF